jgi:hypothetical protein
MTMPLPDSVASAEVQRRWTLIQALRLSAAQELAVIADEVGQDSTLLERCRQAWSGWERQALISILHRDLANAEVILDRGVHALHHALDLIRTDRLSEEDLSKLIAAA